MLPLVLGPRVRRLSRTCRAAQNPLSLPHHVTEFAKSSQESWPVRESRDSHSQGSSPSSQKDPAPSDAASSHQETYKRKSRGVTFGIVMKAHQSGKEPGQRPEVAAAGWSGGSTWHSVPSCLPEAWRPRGAGTSASAYSPPSDAPHLTSPGELGQSGTYTYR